MASQWAWAEQNQPLCRHGRLAGTDVRGPEQLLVGSLGI